MDTIQSISNTKIKKYAKLLQKKYREKESMFLVEGYHLVQEAEKAGVLIETLSSDPKIKGTPVTSEIIKKLSSTKTPQPVIGICKKPQIKFKGDKILVLDNVQDPGNVGTLIRTAKAFEWDGIIISGADVYSPKVIRSSQGSMFSIPIIQTKNLSDEIKKLSIPKIGAMLDKKAIIYNQKSFNKIALILGNEGKGISDEIQKLLDYRVYIPINFESLNVSVAGGILLNEYK